MGLARSARVALRRLRVVAGPHLHAGLRRLLPRSVLRRWVNARLPRAINLELTADCNLACPLCPTHLVTRARPRLPLDHVASVLRDNPALRTACLHVLGEPLLHPELASIVETLESRGVRVHFGTNGMELERHAAALVDAGLSSISVAIDGNDQESYARYRAGGEIDQVVRGVRALVAARNARRGARLHVQIQGIVFPYLEQHVEQLTGFLRSIGADSVVMKEPSLEVHDDAWERAAERGQLRHKRIPRAKARAHEFLAGLGECASRGPATDRPLLRDSKLCPQLEKATVLGDGRVVACCVDVVGETTYGHLGASSLVDIWRSPARRELVRQFQERRLSICSTCEL